MLSQRKPCLKETTFIYYDIIFLLCSLRKAVGQNGRLREEDVYVVICCGHF